MKFEDKLCTLFYVKKKSIYLRQNQNKEKEIRFEFVATFVKVFPGKFPLRILVLPENKLLLK